MNGLWSSKASDVKSVVNYNATMLHHVTSCYYVVAHLSQMLYDVMLCVQHKASVDPSGSELWVPRLVPSVVM